MCSSRSRQGHRLHPKPLTALRHSPEWPPGLRSYGRLRRIRIPLIPVLSQFKLINTRHQDPNIRGWATLQENTCGGRACSHYDECQPSANKWAAQIDSSLLLCALFMPLDTALTRIPPNGRLAPPTLSPGLSHFCCSAIVA